MGQDYQVNPAQESVVPKSEDYFANLIGPDYQAGLVAQSVMSATDTLGHRDVHGLSAIDPRPRQWICVCTMPKDVGMPL